MELGERIRVFVLATLVSIVLSLLGSVVSYIVLSLGLSDRLWLITA